MAAPVNVASYYRGTLFFNYLKFGWSESLEFSDATAAACLVKLLTYAKLRAWCLPAGVKIVYGRVVQVPQIRFSVPLAGLPLSGLAATLTTPEATDMDSVERSACFNFIVDNGKKSIRMIHGLPDATITSQDLVPAAPGGDWIDLVTDPGDGTANPGTIAAAIKAVNSFIGQKCIVPSQQQTLVIGGVTKLGYATNVITGVLSRAVRNRKVGRPFGLSLGKAPIH